MVSINIISKYISVIQNTLIYIFHIYCGMKTSAFLLVTMSRILLILLSWVVYIHNERKQFRLEDSKHKDVNFFLSMLRGLELRSPHID